MQKLPEIKLDHLFNLTDSTGIFQHARYTIPDRNHGYCLDDNVRALLVLALYKKYSSTNSEIERLIQIYLSFIDHAYNPETKRYRNFMGYDRVWLEKAGSEDSRGRTVWAICTLISDDNFLSYHSYLKKLLNQSLKRELNAPHAIAFGLLGLSRLAEKKPDYLLSIHEIIQNESEKLWEYFRKRDHHGWLWYDKIITYDSSRFPQAIISAGYVLANPSLIKEGLKILDWLIFHQFEKGVYHPIGNENWMTPEGKSEFDQQPLEAAAMVDACLKAWKITQDPVYFRCAGQAFDWFTGKNVLEVPVFDPVTGGCRDGLNPNGVNENQGAESTLAWLSSLLQMKLNQVYCLEKTL